MTPLREHAWVSRSRRVIGAALLAAVLVPLPGVMGVSSITVAHGSCQTPFLVYTDPANPGMQSQSGDIAITRDSGLLGQYSGDGRFAGYDINGTQSAIVNTTTGMARVQGNFTATSPDGASTIDVSYTGQVDFAAGMAMGNFVVTSGTGSDAGYHAAGTLQGTVVAPATLAGADVGLC